MIEINSNEQLKLFMLSARPGMHLAMVLGSPYLLECFSHQAPSGWDSDYTNLAVLHLNSLEMSSPVDFSVLAVFSTYWQSALPGAAHFCLSDFFDFFDESTARWLQTVIEQDAVKIITFVQGFHDIAERLNQLEYQDELAYYKNCLDRGLAAVAAIRQQRAALQELRQLSGWQTSGQSTHSLTKPDFTKAKEFLFSNWPDDPFNVFILGK